MIREQDHSRTRPFSTDAVQNHYADLAREYDRKANRACKLAYRRLIKRCLKGARRVVELGAGATDLLSSSDHEFEVAVDMSVPMLRARPTVPAAACLAGDAGRLPCRDAAFDAAFCVNLLEHVPDPAQVLAEAARVVVPGGRVLAVTPNGDACKLLGLLERMHLKLPEGPHRFLTFDDLAQSASPLEVIEHRRFLACPAGPECMVRGIDRLADGRGLFQYLLARKPGPA